jgi:filamentous hemagglutinin family protein
MVNRPGDGLRSVSHTKPLSRGGELMSVRRVVVCGSGHSRLATIIGCVATGWALADLPASAQSVVPSGATQTSATIPAAGSIKVDIAPANGRGVSHNAYTRFDVPAAGVDLNNQTAKAGTIVNEVTSANRSLIEGQLAVVGPKANVILANPNGITVNGGSFVNIGGLGLVTGTVSYNDGRPEIAVSGGDILVERGGLSAAVQQLDLVSKTLRINGLIDDQTADKSLNVSLVAGAAKVAVDPAVGVLAPSGWITTTATPADAAEVSIVIEQGAAIRGGAIRLTATDKGAGVRFAGDAGTTSGDFLITADGKVVVDNAAITAARDVQVMADSVALASRTKQAFLKATAGGVSIQAVGAITSDGVKYAGQDKPAAGFRATGAVNLLAGGDLTLLGNLFPGQLSSVSESLVIESATKVSVTSTKFSSGQDLTFSGLDGVSIGRSTGVTSGLLRLTTSGPAAVDTSTFEVGTSAVIDAQSFLLTSSADVRSTITAVNHGILITSSGDVINEGGLIQGKSLVEGDDRSKGGVTINAGGRVVAETTPTNIGAFYAKDSDLSITASGGIRNGSGRLLADKTVTLASDGAVENITVTTVNADGTGGVRTDAQKEGFLGLSNSRRQSLAFGTYVSGKEVANITGSDKVVITANTIRNAGGEILSSAIVLQGATITNRPTLLGTAEVSQRCNFFFFCSSQSISHVTRDGGTISASDNLSIYATKMFTNEGGNLSGVNGLTITSPTVAFTALLIPQAYSRPGGLSSGFGGNWSRLFYGFDSGTLVATSGNITLHVPGDITTEGLQFYASGSIVTDGSLTPNREPVQLKSRNRKEIGFFRWLL